MNGEEVIINFIINGRTYPVLMTLYTTIKINNTLQLQLSFFIMTSPPKHSSKFYCLTQEIMVVWRSQNNSNSLKIVSKAV